MAFKYITSFTFLLCLEDCEIIFNLGKNHGVFNSAKPYSEFQAQK